MTGDPGGPLTTKANLAEMYQAQGRIAEAATPQEVLAERREFLGTTARTR